MNIILIKKEAQKKIKEAGDLKTLNQIFREYLGKKGEITLIFNSLKNLPGGKRKKIGKEVNLIKESIKKQLKEKFRGLKGKMRTEKIQEEKIDVTRPGKKIETGHFHPITETIRKIEEIFKNMGFSIVEGPEIETEWYNFDSLNMPRDHPSRDMQDTLWLKEERDKKKTNGKSDKKLMRTQTSAVQVRYMEKNNPPFRIIVPGRVFRHEATDVSHEVQFYQCEGLMVDKDISLANLKAILETFIKQFFGEDTKFRWRPGYFPYVEPGLEVDIECRICKGKGCSVCKNSGWVEVIGAGMVHPNVFKAVGYNPKNWQGFAFGMGVDRLVMVKYKINDIRLFYSGDLRFLKQF